MASLEGLGRNDKEAAAGHAHPRSFSKDRFAAAQGHHAGAHSGRDEHVGKEEWMTVAAEAKRTMSGVFLISDINPAGRVRSGLSGAQGIACQQDPAQAPSRFRRDWLVAAQYGRTWQSP